MKKRLLFFTLLTTSWLQAIAQAQVPSNLDNFANTQFFDANAIVGESVGDFLETYPGLQEILMKALYRSFAQRHNEYDPKQIKKMPITYIRATPPSQVNEDNICITIDILAPGAITVQPYHLCVDPSYENPILLKQMLAKIPNSRDYIISDLMEEAKNEGLTITEQQLLDKPVSYLGTQPPAKTDKHDLCIEKAVVFRSDVKELLVYLCVSV